MLDILVSIASRAMVVGSFRRSDDVPIFSYLNSFAREIPSQILLASRRGGGYPSV